MRPPPLPLSRGTSIDALTPAPVLLSVAQIRRLLCVVLPQPVIDAEAVVALIAYHQQRKAAAYRSHRKRLLRRLDKL
jgi:hypothetical protein